jgi:pyrimidine operon attenuation protein/uracil phosphoribosyltransferase
MDDTKIQRALTRIAHEILEHNSGAESLAIIGILTRGAFLAKRIAATIEKLESVKVPVGLMDISLYRDDVRSKHDQPIVQRTDILFDVAGRNIILVDDVLFTGRTIRAALDQIIDFGRPKTIQLAVLVDRGHRELPIKADYVGVNIPTAKTDQVVLEVKEKEGSDCVYVVKNRDKAAAKTAKPSKAAKSPAQKKGKSK